MAELLYCSSDRDTTLEKIAYAKNVYECQVIKAEREEYIKNALLQNYVDQIREWKCRYDMATNIIAKAQGEVGERLKKDRPNLETVKRWLMEDFLNNDKSFKLEHIISGGYEGYYWRFEFSRNGKGCYIEIPVKNRLTPKNVEYAHYGMFVFGIKESEHYWRMLKGTYEMQELAGVIKDWADGKYMEEHSDAIAEGREAK